MMGLNEAGSRELVGDGEGDDEGDAAGDGFLAAASS
jgi:hypothetical protein